MMITFTAHTENGKKVLTMDEYISREETIKRIKECYCTGCNSYNGVRCRACGTGDAIDVIEDAPSCDVVAVRHGRWVDNHCTACGMMPMGDEMWKLCDFEPPRFEKFMDYCPSCGAKMDGGVDDACL